MDGSRHSSDHFRCGSYGYASSPLGGVDNYYIRWCPRRRRNIPNRSSDRHENQEFVKAGDYIRANQAAWNQAAPFHEKSKEFVDLLDRVRQPNYSCLDQVQTEWLSRTAVKGRDVVHLCCNNGQELLSIERLGASNCVGIDISGEFIKQARRLAEAGGLSSRFIECDVYELPENLDQQFDLCILTIGVFGWMPDLDRFFKVISRLLRPGGKLFVHEEHPIVNMFDPEGDDPFRMVSSYFKDEPFIESDIIVYDGQDQGSGPTHYWFVHSLSDILSSCLSSGLKLEEFHEYPDNISSVEFDVYEDQGAQLPLSYVLVASNAE